VAHARKEEPGIECCKAHRDPGIRALYRATGFLLHRIEALEKKVTALTTKVTKQGRLIMGTKQELEEAIAAERAEVQGALASLKTEIQALKDQIASGSPVTPADLDNLIAAVKDISEPQAPPA
jgi:predicted  nucleic acid-binding Zn-ribbon protein